MWQLWISAQRQISVSQGMMRRNALMEMKCSSTLGGCCIGCIMTIQKSSKTPGRYGRSGSVSGKSYGGRGWNRL